MQRDVKAIRSSNVELLRIICMYLIVIHHFCSHGELYLLPPGPNRIIVNMLLPAGKICFDCFVAISCWYLVKSRFKGSRFFRVWLEVLFYNVVFTILTYYLQGERKIVGLRKIFGSCFPILGNSHGFAVAYLVFYLLLPVLKKIQNGLNKKATLYIVAILFFTQSFSLLFSEIAGCPQPFASEFLLFVLVYFIVFYLQQWPIRILNNKSFCFLSFSILLAFLWGVNILSLYSSSRIINIVWAMSSNEFGIISIAMGLLLFLAAKEVKVPYSPAINAVATTTFGILLLHDHNYFRTFVWQIPKALFDYETLNTASFICIIIAVSACIFIVSMIFDALRQVLLESWVIKSRFIMSAEKTLDNYSNEFEKRSENR